jgi:hypothetical protein
LRGGLVIVDNARARVLLAEYDERVEPLGMSDENVALIERLDRVSVRPCDMEAVLETMRDVPPLNRAFEASVDVIRRVLPTQSDDYRLALAFRLHALMLTLANLLVGPDPAQLYIERMIRLTSRTIAAACRCKLKSVDDQPAAFDFADLKAAMDEVPAQDPG